MAPDGSRVLRDPRTFFLVDVIDAAYDVCQGQPWGKQSPTLMQSLPHILGEAAPTFQNAEISGWRRRTIIRIGY